MKKPVPNIFCKSILTGLLFFFISLQLSAQTITNYAFAASTGTFTALTTPTAVTWLGGTTDDGGTDLIPIGFDFWYMGTRYTNVAASTNGWLSLGAVQTDYLYTNSLSASGAPRPVIAPLWDDLDITAATNVTYKTTGAAGSRVFTVQYLNVKWYYLALGSVISFQVKMYESTGKIEFVYRPETLTPTLPSASIGITGTATGSGNFLSVNNAGTGVSSTVEANVTTRPVSGKTYGFTSPVPTAPGSLTFTAVTNTGMTLNWTDLSSNESGFVIYRSTDGVNYSFVSQTAANTTSVVQSGLTSGATYYWKVFAVTEGALSTALSGNQVASCSGAPVLSGTSTETCAGGSTGTITAIASGGISPYTYSLNGGAYQSAATFTGLAAGAYALNAKGNTGCVSLTTVTVNPFLDIVDDQNAAGADSWVGHVYDGINFNSYIGHYTQTENFNESYGGPLTCFTVTSNALPASVYTEQFSAKYRMNSTKKGLYAVDMGSDDGGRLTVDGTMLYNNWNYQSFGLKPAVLINLNSASSLLYEYFESGGDNQVMFQNLTLLFSNTLAANTTQSICVGNTGIAIGGDVFGTLPSGITLSGTGYQWSYSTTPTGTRTIIAGATAATFTPSAAAAPFNAAGTYYIYRNAALSSINNVSPSPYVATNESNAATLTVNGGGQWTGSISTDWSVAGNWCTGTVPTSATNVVIASTATRMPTISSSVSCNSLTMNTGTTLTIVTAGTLNIAGTLTNSGTITNTGTVNFNGTSGQQTFSGVSSFYNLTISNTSGLSLPAAVTVNNNLLITAGTLLCNNFNMAVKGNWTNNAATTAFTAGTGTVTFNNTVAQAIGGTFATTFNNLTIDNVGSTVTLAATVNVSGNLSVSNGTFDMGAFTANRTSTGGILTVANNAALKIGGTNTYPANYTTNTLVVASTIEYSGTNQTVANQLYGNLKLSSSTGAAVKTFPAATLIVVGNLTSTLGAGSSVAFTAAAAITVNGNVSIGASTTFNGSSYIHTIGGNWTNSGTFNGNTGTIVFAGSGTTVSGSGTQNFNNLTVAASLVSFSAVTISLTGNLATTGAGSFSQASGGTVSMTGSGTTISGSSISLDNLSVSGTVSTAISLNITGNIAISGTFTASAGVITMSGASKTISGTGSKNFSVLFVSGSITIAAGFSISSSLSINGSLSASAGTATFTGTTTLSGTANLFNVALSGTSLQLSANSTLGIANTMTITSGTLDVATSIPNTVNFNGTGAQSINTLTYNNLVLSGGNTKTALGSISVYNNITIASGTTFDPGAFTHYMYNDWTNYGSFTAGSSTIQFLGTATTNIIGNTTFNILSINNSTSATQILLESDVSAAIVDMIKGTVLTGTNTLTITNTRTGNDKILGNIKRTHSFTTGVAYAFETPDNTITFSSVSGVTSITVSVIEGQVNEFPFGSSVNEKYSIVVPSGTYNATLRLDYDDNELNGNNESSMTLWHYDGPWNSKGKTANSTTQDYVEKSGLTNITGDWTLSDASNVVQWNGSVSTDWHTAANWTVLAGSASTPPSAADVVDLGTGTFTYQPLVSNNESVKGIHFGSTKAVTLTLTTGGSITVAGNVDGDWDSTAIHTINVNNQNLTVNGDMNLSDGITGQSINVNIASGNVTILHSLIQSGNAAVNFSNSGILNIHMDYNYTGGAFTAGTGTVIYDGDENEDIAKVDYYNLTINKMAGLASLNDTLSIAGNLTVTAGEMDNYSVANIAGNVNIASGATLQNNNMLHVGGNWNNSGNYIATGAHIIFNGTGIQTITATTFNNLIINKPVGSSAILTGDIAIKGDITVTSGTLDIQTFSCDRSTQGGTAALGDSGTIIIRADNAPGNFVNYALANSSTVIFAGTSDQTLLFPDISFGHLIFRNSGVKTLATPVTINGNLTIESGSSFDGGSNIITLNGNWINNGTFTPSASTLLCIGTAKTITGTTTFNLVTVTGSYTILNDVTFNHLLNITSTGSLSGGSTIHTTLNGDLINSGILFTLGSTTFTGNVLQTLSLINAVQTVAITVNFNGTVSPVLNSTSAPQYGFLNINNTAGINASVGYTIAYGLTVGSGASFNGGVSTHNILGYVTNNGTITSSGTLNFVPASATTINLGSNFSSTGTVLFGGAGALTVAGTTDSFHDVVIANTNAAGITPPSDWAISNNLTVNSGSILNAGTYTHTVGGNITNNGTINSGTSTFTLNGAAAQNIYTASAFNNLTLNKATGAALLASNTTVNGILNFIKGQVQTGNNLLIQPSAGTVTGAAQNTGWVNGKLRKNIATGNTAKNFETGDSANYTPVSLAFTNITTAGDLTVFTTAGDHPNISSSVINASKSANRFWTLANSGIICNNYNATFNFTATDVDAGATPANFAIGEYSNTTWTYPNTGTATATSTGATGLTAFQDFQVGEMLIFVKTWDGGAGTNNWGDAANWNSNGVPSATDDVSLTGADSINIDVAATTRHLTLNNSNLILTMQAGKSLAVAGNLTISNGTFNTAAAFPTVTGTVAITGGTVGFTGSAAQTIPAYNYNNITSSSTGSRTLAPVGTIGIAGTFTPGTNVYTTSGSTINFNGEHAQAIATFNYNDLVLSNTGEKAFSADTTAIAGTLTVAGSATANAVINGSTIRYNGSAGQTVRPMPYFNLDAAATGTAVTLTDLAINNNLSISSGTASIGNSATARTITVGGNITIANGASLNVAATSDTTHQLILSGNIVNNGTLDLRPDANSLCNISFNKNGNQTVGGSGTTTRVNNISLNMGTSGSNYLDVTAANFAAPNGFLTLQNGSFNLNSTGVTTIPFTSDISTGNFLIPATAGLWVNAGTINSANMNWTVAGLVKVTGGSLNMGSAAGNTVIPKNTGHFIVNGGNLNLASAISNPGAAWTLEMKGGTMTVNTLGSTAAGIAPFNMDATSGIFNMSGGTIVLQNAGGSTGEYLGFNNLATTDPGFTGGTLQIGNASSAAQTMKVISTMPLYNVTVNNAGTTLLQTTDLTVTNNVTVTAGTFTVNNHILKIGGNVTGAANIIADSGTIEMNGTAAQAIPGTIFTGNTIRRLTINNTAGVSLGGSLNLTDVLTVSNGSLAANGYLTLRSTATATATVGPITSVDAAPITGNVIVERYIPGRRKYRLITSSVTTSAASALIAGQEGLSIWGNWQNQGNNSTANTGTIITGGSSADGFDPQTPNASLFTYDDVNRKYAGYNSANGKNTKYTPLKAGIAYYMFVYGDRLNSISATNPHPTVLVETGTLKTGDQVYNTGSSIPLTGVTGRFTLLGNPYASPVNWATIPKTDLANTYWGWDPNLSSTGGYITVTTTGTVTLEAPYSGTTGLNQYIQPGQGFFVKTTGPAPVLTIREQDKVANFNGNAFRNTGKANDIPLLAVNLLYVSSGNTILADGVLAAFDSSFFNEAGTEDAVKMTNSAESVAIINDTTALSIDARQMPQVNDTLFLNMARLTKPQYTLQIFTQLMENSSVQPYLLDNYLNTLQPLSLSDTNNIAFAVTPGVPASADANRFKIIFRSAFTALPLTFTSIKAGPINAAIQVDWEVADESGIRKYEIEKSVDGNNFYKAGEVAATGNSNTAAYHWLDMQAATGNNFYRVRAMQVSGGSVLSKIVVVKINAGIAAFTVFPNPVQNKALHIRAAQMKAGVYTILLYNQQGQQIIKTSVNHAGGSFNQVVQLPGMLPAGMYYLLITNESGQYKQTVLLD